MRFVGVKVGADDVGGNAVGSSQVESLQIKSFSNLDTDAGYKQTGVYQYVGHIQGHSMIHLQSKMTDSSLHVQSTQL